MKIIHIALGSIVIHLMIIGCLRYQEADEVIYLCHDNDFQNSEAIVSIIREISQDFEHRYIDSGEVTRDDLWVIDANPAIIPSGTPIQSHVETRNGQTQLVASNFGLGEEDLRISLFYPPPTGARSPFHDAVVSRVSTVEGVARCGA